MDFEWFLDSSIETKLNVLISERLTKSFTSNFKVSIFALLLYVVCTKEGCNWGHGLSAAIMPSITTFLSMYYLSTQVSTTWYNHKNISELLHFGKLMRNKWVLTLFRTAQFVSFEIKSNFYRLNFVFPIHHFSSDFTLDWEFLFLSSLWRNPSNISGEWRRYFGEIDYGQLYRTLTLKWGHIWILGILRFSFSFSKSWFDWTLNNWAKLRLELKVNRVTRVNIFPADFVMQIRIRKNNKCVKNEQMLLIS